MKWSSDLLAPRSLDKHTFYTLCIEKLIQDESLCGSFGWRCTWSWEWTLPLDSWSNQRYIPYGMMTCAAYKAGGRRRRRGHSELWSLFSQVIATYNAVLLFWSTPAWFNTCLLMGSSESTPWFALLTPMAFALLSLNCLYLSPRVLSLLLFWLSTPSHQDEVRKWLRGA